MQQVLTDQNGSTAISKHYELFSTCHSLGDLVNTAQKYMLESSSLEGAELFGQRAIAAGNGVDWNRVRLISGTLKFTKLNLTVLEAARFQLQGQILNMKAQPYHICLFKTIQSIVDSSH